MRSVLNTLRVAAYAPVFLIAYLAALVELVVWWLTRQGPAGPDAARD